jgi:4-alpha-glucanotransferase
VVRSAEVSSSSSSPSEVRPERQGLRRGGALLPLFSIRSGRGWGLGEIGDLGPFAAWARSVGLSVVQLLPVNEVSGGESSPYSACSAFALDPVYLSLDQLEDFAAVGGRAGLPAADRAELERLAAAPKVDWHAVRMLKARAAKAAFVHFHDSEWRSGSVRRKQLERYMDEHGEWLSDYSLWRALHDQVHRAWWDWPESWKTQQPAALALAREELSDEILRCCYLQWQLDEQWQAARAQARQLGVAIMGDLPFMVAGDSADVWSRPTDFRLDRTVGTPPDAFSAVGQDWGLPAYDWPRMEAGGFEWLRERAERAGALYDLYRIDHVIGLYRTYSRPVPGRVGEPPGFFPTEEAQQIAQGERVLSLFQQQGEVIAEDLGMVPSFLPASLARLQIPGYRVLRWETEADGSYRAPATWPERSVATNGTHDIEPNAAWYAQLLPKERKRLARVPGLQALQAGPAWSAQVRDLLLQVVYDAPSRLSINPLQDLLGIADRINLPGTVSDGNWTYRMTPDLAALEADGALRERLLALAARSRRLPDEAQAQPAFESARARG